MLSSISRNQVFTLALPVILIITIITSWGAKTKDNSNLNVLEPQTSLGYSITDKISDLQWQIAIGGSEFLKEQGKKYGLESYPKELEPQITESLKQGFTYAFKESHSNPVVIRKILILSKFLNYASETKKFHQALNVLNPKSDVDLIVLRLTDPKAKETLMSASDYKTLKEELPWYSDLLAYKINKNPSNSSLYKKGYQQLAIKLFLKFLIALGGFIIIGILSFIALLFYIIGLSRKWFKPHFHFEGMQSSYCLEIFCLYLTLFLLIPHLLKHFIDMGQQVPFLQLNVILMLALVWLTLWPTFFGTSRADIAKALGLEGVTIFGVFREIGIGVSFYLASLIPFFILLLIYQFTLQQIGANPAEGTHPIVPMLESSSDSTTIIWIAVLAIIIAPLIEEIMFRGVLYRWLRGRLSPTFAILLSSTIFAAVHPQGLIGLVPLSFIGCLAATLREWRQSLIASMALHACFNSATLIMIITFLR